MGTFGQRLKREREMRGIGLEEIANSTKIGIRMLRALEDERFELLPGGIFNKGFVRAYAKHVGIDEEQAVADFLVATGEVPAPSALEPEPEERAAPSGSRPWIIAAVALGVLAAAGLGAWKWYGREAATGPPGAVPASGPAAGATATTGGPAQPPAAATAVEPRQFTLRIRALRDCWVVVMADGRREEWTLPAQSEKLVQARQSIVLTVGNAGGVEVSFNEQVLEPLGAEDQPRTVMFTPEGMRPE